jgi:hypothetical protein
MKTRWVSGAGSTTATGAADSGLGGIGPDPSAMARTVARSSCSTNAAAVSTWAIVLLTKPLIWRAS